jgi:hypothetical protein
MRKAEVAMNTHTADLGMFALGSFIGAILTFGLSLMKTYSNWAVGGATIISSALGGSVVIFIGKYFPDPSASISAYCVGLLIALMWAYTSIALQNIASEKLGLRILGWIHIGASVVCTLLGGLIFAIPRVVDAWKQLFPN